MKGRVLTFDLCTTFPDFRWLESICLSLKSHKLTHNSCEVFGPLRVSESQSTTRKAAAVAKVAESVVSSNYIWSESIITK